MKDLICITLIFCVLVAIGDETKNGAKEEKEKEIEEDYGETKHGNEVLLITLPKAERELYETYLKKAIETYNGLFLGTLYNLRNVNETTLKEDQLGHFTLRFFTLTQKCSLGMHLIQELDGTETVVPDQKTFNIFRPFKCQYYMKRKAGHKKNKIKTANRNVG